MNKLVRGRLSWVVTSMVDRTARALSADEVVTWLALLDADDFARQLDLPELARFILDTGLRLGRYSVSPGPTSTWSPAR